MEKREAVSFEKDIRPLFRAQDIDHMRPMGILLDDYTYMSQRDNAKSVQGRLDSSGGPQMPPGGPYWTREQLDLFAKWIDAGCPP